MFPVVRFTKNFKLKDFFQQVVGGFILAGPFVVTAEVWELASGMAPSHVVTTFGIVLITGYATLYKAEQRDLEQERRILGFLPVRFISLIFVSYLSVTVLALTFNAPETFNASNYILLKAASISAIFSVLGAATADSLF